MKKPSIDAKLTADKNPETPQPKEKAIVVEKEQLTIESLNRRFINLQATLDTLVTKNDLQFISTGYAELAKTQGLTELRLKIVIEKAEASIAAINETMTQIKHVVPAAVVLIKDGVDELNKAFVGFVKLVTENNGVVKAGQQAPTGATVQSQQKNSLTLIQIYESLNSEDKACVAIGKNNGDVILEKKGYIPKENWISINWIASDNGYSWSKELGAWK